MRTFRIKTKEDSKVTVINVARKVTRQLIIGPSRVTVTRPIFQEARTRKHALSVDGKVILSPSATESLGIPDMRSLSHGSLRTAETKKQAMLRYFLQALKILQRNLLSLLSQSNSVLQTRRGM